MERIITITWPSWVWKTTLVDHLIKNYGDYFWDTIACTTRGPREWEKDWVDYHFLDTLAFEKLMDNWELATLSNAHGNIYGHTYASLQKACVNGKTWIVITDMERICQYKLLKEKIHLEVISLLLVPPSYITLGKRVIKRDRSNGTDYSETKERWVHWWQKFVSQGRLQWVYDYEIINESLESSAQKIKSILWIR
jgi:guanylate kinase